MNPAIEFEKSVRANLYSGHIVNSFDSSIREPIVIVRVDDY